MVERAVHGGAAARRPGPGMPRAARPATLVPREGSDVMPTVGVPSAGGVRVRPQSLPPGR
jgi:hypothetical protein